MTSKEYHHRAQECLELAKVSAEVYVQVALTELAEEFKAAAHEAERDGVNDNEVVHRGLLHRT